MGGVGEGELALPFGSWLCNEPRLRISRWRREKIGASLGYLGNGTYRFLLLDILSRYMAVRMCLLVWWLISWDG